MIPIERSRFQSIFIHFFTFFHHSFISISPLKQTNQYAQFIAYPIKIKLNNKSNHHFSQNVIPIDFHLFGAYISRISRYQTWLTVIFSIVGVSQLFSNDTINFQLKHFLAIPILRMGFFIFQESTKYSANTIFFSNHTIW